MASITIDVPLPRSNEDHLEIFAAAGEKFGAALAEQIAANLRVAASCGLKGASVGKYLEKLSALGLVAGAEAERARLASLGICRDASHRSSLMATALGDIEFCCKQDLLRRGYRANQVARFKVRAWRAFKITIRKTLDAKVH